MEIHSFVLKIFQVSEKDGHVTNQAITISSTAMRQPMQKMYKYSRASNNILYPS